MGFIYKITNTINNKSYIGQTKQKDPQYRWKDHVRSMKTGVNGCPLLIASAKKYGIESFKFEILIICFDEDLNTYEIEYIKKLNTQVPNGYNITDGGHITNSFKNKQHTEETKQKLREITLKRFQDPNEIVKHRNSIQKFYDNGGMEKSEKWKEYFKRQQLKKTTETPVKNKRSKKISDEIKDKISNSLIDYFKIENNRQKHKNIMTSIIGKRVSQYSIENVLLNKYVSVTEASKITGIKRAAISSCANGRNNTSGGYIWRYENL